MNVIFLDVDGVLNDAETLFYTQNHRLVDISEQKLFLFGTLCKEYNCKVVISSSWRYGMDPNTLECRKGSDAYNLMEALKRVNVEVIGRTEETRSGDRGFEINKYIKDHLSKDDKILILDDEDVTTDYMKILLHPELKDLQYQTSFSHGFDFTAYKRCQAYFENDQNWKTKEVTFL